MNKKFLLLIYLFYFTFTFALSDRALSKEDVEILKLEKQIKILNEKITILKKAKEKNKTPKTKVGLVLSGGGAKGFAHIGALKVLEENNIKIDYIVGSSIGALIGSMYSIGYTPDEIENYLLNFDWNDSFYNDNPNRTDTPLEERLGNNKYAFSLKYDSNFNFSFPISLKKSQKNYLELKKLFKKVNHIKDFNKLPIPIRIIATNLDTGKAEAFEKGDLAMSVLASTAIPSIFPSISIDGYHYVDSLVTRNFPVEDAINMGATKIIGVNVGKYISKKIKEKYNIITTAEQILSIQSASSTEFQKKLATVLIEPQVSNYSSTDYKDAKEIISLGIKATEKKLGLLDSFPKEKKKKTFLKEKNFFFEKTNIIGISNPDKIAIIENILSNYIGKEISTSELNRISMRLYGLDFISKVFYSTEKNILNLSLEESPSNTLGIGFNYQSNYYTNIKLATDLRSFGKFGYNTNIFLKAGDYLGIGIKNLFYYGLDNKFGVSIGLNYDESPLFLYNESQKEVTIKNRTFNFDFNINTLLKNKILFSYGFNLKTKKFNTSSGSYNFNDLPNSDVNNYGQGYLKFLWDTADAVHYPKNGFIGNVSYFWGGGFEKYSSDFSGSVLSFAKFTPINKKLSFASSISFSNIEGSSTSIDDYLKLGGDFNNLEKNEFSFSGYAPQEKLLENLALLKLSFQYEIFNNLYITSEYNIATFKEYSYFKDDLEDNLRFWNDYVQGFKIGLGYLSPLGPVSFSISRNDFRKELIYQFSIGYTIN